MGGDSFHAQRGAATLRAIGGTIFLAGVLVTALAWPAGASGGTPTRPVDRTIDKYVLFALEEMSFKGGQGSSRGFIHGGDVGVNAPGRNGHNPRLSICSNAHTTMDDGSQVVAASMRLTNECSVWDVYTNDLVGTPPVSPRNSGPTGFAAPIIAPGNLPPLPAFTCNPANPITVPKGGSLDLAPGVYGDLRVRDGASLTLHAGDYTFCDWRNGRKVRVTTVSGAVVRIAKSFHANNGSYFGPACDAKFYLRADGLGPHDHSVTFGKRTTVYGTWWSPNGAMALGHSTNLHGHFWAKSMGSDWNVNVDGCTPPPPPSTSTSSSSTSSTSSSSTSSTSTSSTSTSSTSTTSPSSSTSPTSEGSSTTTNPSISTLGSTTPTSGGPTTAGGPGPGLPVTGSGGRAVMLGYALLVMGGALVGLGRKRRIIA